MGVSGRPRLGCCLHLQVEARTSGSTNWPIRHQTLNAMSLWRDAPVPQAVAVMDLSPWTRDGGRRQCYNTELRAAFPAYFYLLHSCLESQEPVQGTGETLQLCGNSTLLQGLYPKARDNPAHSM